MDCDQSPVHRSHHACTTPVLIHRRLGSRGQFRTLVVHFGSPQLLPGTGCAALRPGVAAFAGPCFPVLTISGAPGVLRSRRCAACTLRASNSASGALRPGHGSLPSSTPESSRRCAGVLLE